MINIALWDAAIGAISDGDQVDLNLEPKHVPGLLKAHGLSAGESIEIMVEAIPWGTYTNIQEGGSTKALTADDNSYLIESAGRYRLTFQGSGDAANAAAVEIGYMGG